MARSTPGLCLGGHPALATVANFNLPSDFCVDPHRLEDHDRHAFVADAPQLTSDSSRSCTLPDPTAGPPQLPDPSRQTPRRAATVRNSPKRGPWARRAELQSQYRPSHCRPPHRINPQSPPSLVPSASGYFNQSQSLDNSVITPQPPVSTLRGQADLLAPSLSNSPSSQPVHIHTPPVGENTDPTRTLELAPPPDRLFIPTAGFACFPNNHRLAPQLAAQPPAQLPDQISPRLPAQITVQLRPQQPSQQTPQQPARIPAQQYIQAPPQPKTQPPPEQRARQRRAVPATMPSPASGNAGNVKRPAVEGDDENDRSKGPIKTTTAPSASGPKKQARGDRGQEDYSAKVKTRMSTYTRTGQACDRCKVRKIRCDALPDGCSSCSSQAIKCFVTDRVSGRTERRGYLRDLERENDSLLSHIRELEQLVAEKGVQVWPFAATVQSETGPAPDGADQPITNPMKVSVPLEDGWDKLGSLWVKPSDSKDAPLKPLLVPNFPRSRLESRPEETWLGVGWDSRPLSSINGTTLTIMGTTIDTASFDAPDMDEPPSDSTHTTPLYNKSVQAFLQSASGLNPPVEISLPPREEAFTYTQYYFMFMASYIPILHKPTFMRLLERVYDEPDFKPTTAELVQVHMVFAIIFYQYGVRNWQEAEQSAHLNATSNKHYHFAISKFYELYASRDVAALQAMTLLAAHTRSFPKPGCGLLITNLAFQRAIDLDYHRNPKIPETGTNLGIELRKRIWWVLITIYVAVTGRRGRPMPITVEEFDTGFPEPLNDEQLTETGVDRTQSTPCNWQVGLATFKLIPIMMEMYSNIYSVRRDTQNYGTIVTALEKELDKWESELPADLRLDLEQAPQQHNLGALYLKGYCLEVRLSLRHTSTSPITDQETMAQNTKICEETARELLRTVKYVSELKSLDTTWTQMSIYTMAAFSLLVSYWTRRKETTPDEIATLRQEMEDWMGVLRELSQLMGSGPGILNQIGSIIERTIIWIENETARPPPPPAIKQEPVHHGALASQQIQNQGTLNQSHNAPAVRLKADQAPTDASVGHVQAHGPVEAGPATTPTNAHAPQQVHHQHQHQHQQQHSLQPRASPHQIAQQQQVHPERAGEKHFYHDHTQEMNGPPSYPITYTNHSPHDGALTAQPYEHETAMYYSAASQHAAPPSVVSVPPGTESNPLIAFASQAAQHVNTTEQLIWQRAGGNAWQDWTAAIADSDDRYGAGALLTLGNTGAVSGSGHRGSIASMSGAQHNPQDIAVQWPMVINTMVDPQNPHIHLQQQQQHHPHHTQHPHHQQHVHQ